MKKAFPDSEKARKYISKFPKNMFCRTIGAVWLFGIPIHWKTQKAQGGTK